MSVPFVDLRRDAEVYREDYRACFERVLNSGVFSLGPEVEGFEKAFAEYVGTSHAIACANGTMALYASFLALGIGTGDEVIVPANTFIATAEAIVMTGARPIFCDIDPSGYHFDLKQLVQLVTSRTKAICAVHLYGHPIPNLKGLLTWAKERNLFVVEDVSQAHGATLDGKRLGSWGDVAAFSCYPTKNLGALGEGGVITTQDANLAARIRAIRTHGITKEKYHHTVFGSNLKMEALQGAFLQSKLVRLDKEIERRRSIATRYREAFASLPWLTLPPEDVQDQCSVYHLFVVRVKEREKFIMHLGKAGISTSIHYPIPLPEQPSMQSYAPAACPVASAYAREIVSLPLFPLMSDEEIAQAITAVQSFTL